MRLLLSCFLVISLLVSPLVALEPISEMTTEEILSELSDNTKNIVNLSEEGWKQSVESRKESEASKALTEKSDQVLEELKKDNEILVTEQSNQESLVIEMNDSLMSLNADLAQEKLKTKNQRIAIIVLGAVALGLGGIAIFK